MLGESACRASTKSFFLRKKKKKEKLGGESTEIVGIFLTDVSRKMRKGFLKIAQFRSEDIFSNQFIF
jgi:hypothetical protein